MIETTYPASSESTFEPLQFDAELYLSRVQDLEVSEEDAWRFLESMWTIMVAFVDLGFDLSQDDGPVGQIVKAAIALEAESRRLLESSDQFQEHESVKTEGPSKVKAQTDAEDS